MKQRLSIAAILVLCTVTVSAETNWPQWRGPTGTGETSAAATITQWGPDTNVRWRTELPEPGNSTPIMYGEKIFLTQPLGIPTSAAYYVPTAQTEANDGDAIWVVKHTRGVMVHRWPFGATAKETLQTHNDFGTSRRVPAG